MPILALTANALCGESLRAEASGMDEYLTKPLQLQFLKAAFTKWLRPDAVPAAFTRAASAPEASALDVTVLTDLVGDDPKIVRDFLGHFQTSAQRLANELRGFRATDDLRQIGAVAHKLRSSSRSVGALVLGDLCAELENSCRTGTRESILQGMVRFEAALLEVDAKIDDLLVAV